MSQAPDFMDRPPTDSVLRRHYEQLRAAAVVVPAADKPAGVSSARSAAAPPAPSAPAARGTSAPVPARPEAKGLRAWLGRLFGG